MPIAPYEPERQSELAAKAAHDDHLITTEQSILAEFEDDPDPEMEAGY